MSTGRIGDVPWFMALLFSGIGIVALVACVWLTQRQYMLRQEAEHATGRVVELLRSCDKDGCHYKPVVEFEALDVPVRITGMVGSSPPAYDVGEQVQVLYPVGAPQEGQIDSLLESWFGTVFSGIFALAFGGAGAAMVVGKLRGAKQGT